MYRQHNDQKKKNKRGKKRKINDLQNIYMKLKIE